ncbi:Xaa-Pro aminopeptidase, partial [Pseudoloma neurophilia]
EQNENRPTVESKRIKTNQHDIFLSTKYNAYIHSKLKNKSVTNLIADLKAIKNDIEILGMLQANIIDGIALTKLFYYLKKIIINNENMPTETEFGDLIFKYRQNATEILTKDKNFITQHSFEPIVGSGIDSAIIHYRPHEKVISNEKVLLLDTGGQYIFGTTDITRTLHLGSYDFESQDTSKDNQSKRTSKDIKSKTTSKDIKLKGTSKDKQSKDTSKLKDTSNDKQSKDTLKDTPCPRDMFKKYFTLVLQGLLRSSRLTSTKKAFHKLFTDIARLPLFDYFYDYPHGTSHGVGHSNNVHENDAFNDGAQIRNVISLEPGAYFPDKFGIRIENCVVTVLKNIENDNFLTTMQLTFVPLQRDLIIKNMLDQKEKETLNEYNRNVYDFLNQYLTNEEREWLKEETAIIE